MNSNTRLVVEAFTNSFADQKKMSEKAVAQLADQQLHVALDENTNCLAAIMKHMAGNLNSRFTDFLTTDGEKPDRDRDAEFIADTLGRPTLMAMWNDGWNCLLHTLAQLSDADLPRIVTIRGQPHTVADAPPAPLLTRAITSARSFSWPVISPAINGIPLLCPAVDHALSTRKCGRSLKNDPAQRK